jgi:hypothetical protein
MNVALAALVIAGVAAIAVAAMLLVRWRAPEGGYFARNEAFLAEFYLKRFRKEFKPAVNAWLATRPRRNPSAPLTPCAMPEYRLAATAEAARLDASAEELAAKVRRNIQRSTNYVLGVVLFAVALFFAGMSTKLAGPGPRKALLLVGWVVFTGAATWIATSPVSVSI